MSITSIDLKINSAVKSTKALQTSKQTWQEQVDNLLDRMNELNKILNSLHSLVLTLTFEIERDFDGFKQSEVAPVGIKTMVTSCTQLLNLVKKSDLFPGVKTTYYTLKQEISYINELAHDRLIGKQLDNDLEMQQLINNFTQVSKRA